MSGLTILKSHKMNLITHSPEVTSNIVYLKTYINYSKKIKYPEIYVKLQTSNKWYENEIFKTALLHHFRQQVLINI